MKRIDVLLRRAQRLSPPRFPVLTILSFENGSYNLSFSVWDGGAGSGTDTRESVHETRQAALEEYDRLLSRYRVSPSMQPVLIDLSDLMGGEADEQEATALIIAERSTGSVD